MTVFLLVLGLVLFIGLILVHEWGHFIAARKSGVVVEEYGVFFPPRLYKKRMKNGWDFTINLLPLGGFVKLKGEHDSDVETGSFGAASLKAKSLIMAAGVIMNLAVAYVLFVVLALWGMPHLVDNQYVVKNDTHYVSHAKYTTTVGSVEQGSPAAKIGLKADDAILALGPVGHLQPMTSDNDSQMPNLTKRYSGQIVQVRFRHGDQVVTKQVKLRSTADIEKAAKAGKTIGRLGVSTYVDQDGMTVVRSTWSAPIVAAGTMVQFTALTFEGLGHALWGLGGIVAGAATHNTTARQAAQTEASNQVSGPIGVYFVFKYGAALGLQFIVMVVAILSLTLGIMNILPIPALDGGRLWLMLITRAINKPLDAKREELINAVGFLVLIGLMVLISVVDVKRFF